MNTGSGQILRNCGPSDSAVARQVRVREEQKRGAGAGGAGAGAGAGGADAPGRPTVRLVQLHLVDHAAQPLHHLHHNNQEMLRKT